MFNIDAMTTFGDPLIHVGKGVAGFNLVGVISTWILATGFWRDEGFWDDTKVWID